jgi:hypothetical protein
MFVFPQPFGPTIEVTPSLNFIEVFCAKDLKPNISSFDKYNYSVTRKD